MRSIFFMPSSDLPPNEGEGALHYLLGGQKRIWKGKNSFVQDMRI